MGKLCRPDSLACFALSLSGRTWAVHVQIIEEVHMLAGAKTKGKVRHQV